MVRPPSDLLFAAEFSWGGHFRTGMSYIPPDSRLWSAAVSLLNAGFEGLTDDDFDHYQPQCWSNNRYNLGRMRAKERLGVVIEALRECVSADGLAVEASSEIPSVWNGRQVKDQWAYVIRDGAHKRRLQPVMAKHVDLATRLKAPAEHLQHALMAVRLDHEALEISLRLNAHAVVDLINLLARAEVDVGPLEAALNATTDEIMLDGAPVTLSSLISAGRATRGGEREWVVVGQTIPRDAAIAAGAGVLDVVRTIGASIAPMFEFVLWREDNDHVGVESQLDSLAAERAETVRMAQEARAQKQKAHAERAESARARTKTRIEAESMWRKVQAKNRSSSSPPAVAPPDPRPGKRPPREAARRQPAAGADQRGTAGQNRSGSGTERRPKDAAPKKSASSARPNRRKAPAETFEVGARCRLTRGLFAGKEGEIRGADKPGYYKVRVGTLEVAVSAYELQKLD